MHRCDHAFGQPLDLHGGQQHFERAGRITQPRGHVDRRADVVVAFEQQRVAGGDAHAQGERRAHFGGAMFQLERERDARALLDGHDHATIAQPLGDAHAALAGDLTGDGAKRAEQASGGIVAEGCGVVREPGQVDERERSGNAHQGHYNGTRGLREGFHKRSCSVLCQDSELTGACHGPTAVP